MVGDRLTVLTRRTRLGASTIKRNNAHVVEGVTPATGDAGGGEAVTVTGMNFTGATGVTFDGVAATSVVVVSDTSITCNTPAGTGLIDVAVTTPRATRSLTDGFTYGSAPAGALFSDGLESGDLTFTENGAAWGTFQGGGADGPPTVESDNPDAGTYAIRFHYDGSASQSDDAWSEGRLKIGQGASEVWVKQRIYFPDGTEGFGSAEYLIRNVSPSNNKLFRIWGGTGSNNGYSDYFVKSGFSLRRVASTGAIEIIPEFGTQYQSPTKSMDQYGRAAWKPAITAAWKGLYVTFRYHFKVATSANNDGVIELAADNGSGFATKISHTNLDNYPVTASSPSTQNLFRYMYFMGWANSGFDSDTRVWIDAVEVYLVDPGWSF